MQKVNDKAFLEKFPVKESSILIGLENFGAKRVSHYGLVGVLLLNKKLQKMTRYPHKAYQLKSEGSQFKTH